MANIAKIAVAAGLWFGLVLGCSAGDGGSGTAPLEATRISREALTSCTNDYQCDFGPGFLDGEHCGLDGVCHTAEADPSCGLWTGTFPDCDFLDPCRTMYCADGTECLGVEPYLCSL